MGAVRMTYRVFKVILFLYGLSTALLRSRWLAIGIALWRLLRKRRVRPVSPAATLMFVNASEPAIYRRTGFRKLIPTRRLRRIK